MKLTVDQEEIDDAMMPFVGDLTAFFKVLEEDVLDILDENIPAEKMIGKMEKLLTE